MSEMSQKEEYLYIIKNHDVQKLINDSNLPESDKNIIKEKVLSNDVDLSEKLKILNYLLKYQRSEHYRGEILVEESKKINSKVLLEPGYYAIELNGANAGAYGSAKDMMALDVEDISEFKNSIYNFIIQKKKFISTSNQKDSIFFTTDFKWYLFSDTLKCGSFELNDKGIFLHLDLEYKADSGYKIEDFASSSTFPKNNIENLDKSKAYVMNEKFYDYSSYFLDPMAFNENYKLLNFKKIGQFKSSNEKEYETFSVMENFGLPDKTINVYDREESFINAWNRGAVDLKKYPKYNKEILSYADRPKPKDLPVSCTEKLFPYFIYLNRNLPAGGSGAKLIKIIKVREQSICEYSVGEAGQSSFTRPSNGEDSSVIIKSKTGVVGFSAKSEGGFSTKNGVDRLSDTNNDLTYKTKTWVDSIDNTFLTQDADIDFSVGEKSFLDDGKVSSLDYFSGKSSYVYYDGAKHIEPIDDVEVNNIFYGSDIKGQGVHLNDFETNYYQDPSNGYLKITYLGPLSSDCSTVKINGSSILTTSKSFSAPNSSTCKVEIKCENQKHLIDLKNSTCDFLDKDGNVVKSANLFDLYYHENSYTEDEDFKFLDLQVEKKNEYYNFVFKITKDIVFNIITTENNRYVSYDESLVGGSNDVLSVKCNSTLCTLTGDSIQNQNIEIAYKDNDYSFDIYLASLYNHNRYIDDFDGLKRRSFLSFENKHNTFISFNNLFKKYQLSFSKGNSLSLEDVYDINSEKILEAVPDAKILKIEYCFSLEDDLIEIDDFTKINVIPDQKVYVKITYNTFRIRVSKLLSGLQSKQILYPMNYDLKEKKEIIGANIQWIEYTCNSFSEKVVLNIERNTFKFKLMLDLYSLLDFKTISNKEDYEYGEEVALSFQLRKEQYISIRDLLPEKGNDYLLHPSPAEKYESSLVVGSVENTIRFGDSSQYSDNKKTFYDLVDGKVTSIRELNSKKNVFFVTLEKNVIITYPDVELCFIRFRMPQNNIKARLTTDYIPNSKLIDIVNGFSSYTFNKGCYSRLICSGGNTGNGGSGASLGNYDYRTRSGGSGASGFIGGGGGNGNSTSAWEFYWELPSFSMGFDYTSFTIIKVAHFTVIKGLTFSYHWNLGIRNYEGGPPGAGAAGFLNGGLPGTKGRAFLENVGSIKAFEGSDDTGPNADEGFRVGEKGLSFSTDNPELSKYRGRFLDCISLLSKKDNKLSCSISASCGSNGVDGFDGVGAAVADGDSDQVVMLEDKFSGIGSDTIKDAVKIYHATINGGSDKTIKPAMVASRSAGCGVSGGAPSAGSPSLISSTNLDITIKLFDESTLLKAKSDGITQTNIICGGGVDGASSIVGSRVIDDDRTGSYNEPTWELDLFHLSKAIREGGAKTPARDSHYCLKILERYPNSKNKAYLPYILLPLTNDFSYESDKVSYPFGYSSTSNNYEKSEHWKMFGNGGGKTMYDLSKSKDHDFSKWLSNGGSTGKIDSIFRSLLTQKNRVISCFSPNVNEDISIVDKALDFSSMDKLLNVLKNVKTADVETNLTPDTCSKFKNIGISTIIGDAPNKTPICRVIYLGPQYYFDKEDHAEYTLEQLVGNSQTILARNWSYQYKQVSEIPEEF